MNSVVLALAAVARKSATPPSSTPGMRVDGATPTDESEDCKLCSINLSVPSSSYSLASIDIVHAVKRTLPDAIADCSTKPEFA